MARLRMNLVEAGVATPQGLLTRMLAKNTVRGLPASLLTALRKMALVGPGRAGERPGR